MKILIASDSFKGCLSAIEVGRNIEIGIKNVCSKIEVINVPMADGGEGTVQALIDATGGRLIYVNVTNPLFKEIEVFYGILGDGETAIIEMAAASGLMLISKGEMNPMKTSTFGTGQLIKDALDKGCKKIILGLGGSATNDGGIGMMAALGVKFLDHNNCEIPLCGEGLEFLKKIDCNGIDNRLKNCSISAACDVDNPLYGEHGASKVFGPQKGADELMVKILDDNLKNYGLVIKQSLNLDVSYEAGAGAAGGMGAAVLAFLKGELKSGVDIVMKTVKLEEKLKGVDIVITGEGMIDSQTSHGKTPYGVANLAKKHKIPVIAIAGSIGKSAEELYQKGFDSIFSIVDSPMTLEFAIDNCDVLLQRAAERILRVLLINK